MMFMNEYDVERAVRRFDTEDTINLHHAAINVKSLMRWANANSDGWAYWPKPARAAKQLMELIYEAEADWRNPQDVTREQVKAALRPVKAFLTRQGVDHHAVIVP